MDFRRILAVDMGTRNFAWCVVDNNSWRSPVEWHVEDLVARSGLQNRKPTRQDLVTMAWRWVERNEQIITTCDVVVLERQMRTPFIIMNAVIQARCFGKCVEVHPTTVGAFWKLPRDRLRKKAAGIEAARRHITCEFPTKNKLDDLADAWMMAVFVLVREGALGKRQLRLE